MENQKKNTTTTNYDKSLGMMESKEVRQALQNKIYLDRLLGQCRSQSHDQQKTNGKNEFLNDKETKREEEVKPEVADPIVPNHESESDFDFEFDPESDLEYEYESDFEWEMQKAKNAIKRQEQLEKAYEAAKAAIHNKNAAKALKSKL